MATSEKNILNRMYLVAGGMFLFALFVAFKLCNIQLAEGDKYKELAEARTERMFTIPANRGNLYAGDGSLLATSVPKYDILFDAFMSSLIREKPDFCTFFTNHVASSMHRFWEASFLFYL